MPLHLHTGGWPQHKQCTRPICSAKASGLRYLVQQLQLQIGWLQAHIHQKISGVLAAPRQILQAGHIKTQQIP
jgi:hypothetical protein